MTATIPETTGLTGQMLIAGEPVRGSGKPINAFDPTAGETLEPAYHYGDSSNVDAACAAAAAAFPVYRATTSEQRAQFLEAIASNKYSFPFIRERKVESACANALSMLNFN